MSAQEQVEMVRGASEEVTLAAEAPRKEKKSFDEARASELFGSLKELLRKQVFSSCNLFLSSCFAIFKV